MSEALGSKAQQHAAQRARMHGQPEFNNSCEQMVLSSLQGEEEGQGLSELRGLITSGVAGGDFQSQKVSPPPGYFRSQKVSSPSGWRGGLSEPKGLTASGAFSRWGTFEAKRSHHLEGASVLSKPKGLG